MASAIDDTKPIAGTPTTQSVRDNFAAAKSEITALQTTVPATWAIGSVVFATTTVTLGQDNTQLFWDNANDRLGIGTPAPIDKFDIRGNAKVSAASGPSIVAFGDNAQAANNGCGVFVGRDLDAASSLSLGGYGGMYFHTSDATGGLIAARMTITAGGDVGIGTTAPNYKIDVRAASAAGSVVSAFRTGPNGADSSSYLLLFSDFAASLTVGSITRNATGVVYATTSDARLKTDIAESGRGREALMAIKVSDYRMGGVDQQGLLAQDVAAVYPEAVHVGGEDPATEPWMIDYGRLTPLLIRTIQQQQAVLDSVLARLAALEGDSRAAAPTPQMTSTWDSGASTWDSGASVWDVAPLAYMLTASRAGAGSVVLTATVGVARLAHQIVGVGVVDGTTTVTPAPPPSARQYTVTVNTG